MRTLTIRYRDYQKMIKLSRRSGYPGWHAVFSCNEYGEVWPTIKYGYHPEEDREYIENLNEKSPLLKRIVDIFLREREPGGRIFINRKGAYYYDEEIEDHVMFIKFNITDYPRVM